jgi:hypothetical protein
MTLLEEVFQTPGAKAVVFSQWRLTHELIKRRLAERGWDHVQFDGNVPGEQRGALVERFHANPACRLFLSTDAGGVGLNLQHAAAVVVNTDLPWNPALLEQRIGRVHRMGQTRGVQVVQFIGQGSIEEGMLSVLAFKASLSAGVLDGGESEVFLSGTRLARFLQSVEQVAGAMGEAETASATLPAAAGDDEAAQAPPAAPAPPPAPDPWPALLQAGAALLQALAAAREPPDAAIGTAAGPEFRPAATTAALRIETDPATGRPSLRLPLPDPGLMQQIAKALEPWMR